MPDNESNEKIRLFNKKQLELFNTVLIWTKHSVKKNELSYKSVIEPLSILLTDNACCGKSFLMKPVY